MNVLMLGWEFPPFFAGGVGVVCEAMTRALSHRGMGVTYLMPRGPERTTGAGVRVLSTSGTLPAPAAVHPAAGSAATCAHDAGARDIAGRIAKLCYAAGSGNRAFAGSIDGAAGRRCDAGASLVAGACSVSGTTRAAAAWSQGVPASGCGSLYGSGLLADIDAFAAAVVDRVVAAGIDYEVIHAHDWTTFRAGLELRRATGKPLVAHVHITEFDKSGGEHADPAIYALEREGMLGADVVVTVSERVRRSCIERYQVPAHRCEVVYNGVEADTAVLDPVCLDAPMILFLGRVTLQKGPAYFLEAAARVHAAEPGVRFVMAGAGDMLPAMVEQAAELGLGGSILFPGFVDRHQAAILYRSASVFVMPSVSEPFGIVPLEAMDQCVPTIVSRQSGAAEVLRNAMKADFWNVEELAEKMLAAIRYHGLARELARNGRREVARMGWDGVAAELESLYCRTIP